MTMPARFRPALEEQAQESSQLTLTKHPDGCLLVFTQPAWERFRAKVAALPVDAMRVKRMFLGFASLVDIDKAGRVLIDPVLRDFAGLADTALLMGMGDNLEIWNPHRYQRSEDELTAAGTAALPDSIKSLIY